MPFEQPTLRYDGLGQYDVTNEPVYEGRHQRIVVPRGTKTDLASSPRIFWALVPPFGAYEAAAVLHDYLCQCLSDWYRYIQRGCPPGEWVEVPPASSRDTDGLFRRVMREGGVPWHTRWPMWAAVRLGALANPARRQGWWSWPEAPLVFLITLVELVIVIGVFAGVHELINLIGGLL